MQRCFPCKMEKQRWPLFHLLLTWMMAGGGMGAVLKGPEDRTWVVTEWSPCSASCGGVRVRFVYCVNRYGVVSDECQLEKPSSLVQCNLDKCPTPGSYPRDLWLQNKSRKETSSITAETNVVTDSNELQSAKQASTGLLEWTLSEWSECSATCGGGFRVRSVRCLDECGIISSKDERCNTSKESRPSTYEFCAQIDCDTGVMDENILPPNGTYSSSIPDGSFSVLDFTSTTIERYQVSQNITENDGVITLLMETVMDIVVNFVCQIRGADIDLSVGQPQGINVVFINGEVLFELDCVETNIVEVGQTVTYDGSTVTVQGNEFTNISIFWYCDSFRCYMFNSSKSSFEMTGPTSKLFTSKNIALYTIDGQINSDIEDILLNPPPILTSEPVTTMATTSTTSLMPSTALMMTSTILFPSAIPFTSVMPTTSQVTVDTSTIALATSVSTLIPTFAMPSSLLLTPFTASTTLTTSLPSESITPTPTGITISPTQVSIAVTPTDPGRPSISTAVPSVTLVPTSTIGPDIVDPTRDETLCPRQTPIIKPKTKKRRKPRPETKTRDTKTRKTKKDTGKKTRTFKTETRMRSDFKSLRRTKTGKSDYMNSYTAEGTECPPEKTRVSTRRRKTKKTRITPSMRTRSKTKTGGRTRTKSKTSASPPDKTTGTKATTRRTMRITPLTRTRQGPKTGSRTRATSMALVNRRRISLPKLKTNINKEKSSKEKMEALIGVMLMTGQKEPILSTMVYKTIRLKQGTEVDEMLEELFDWRPDIDCNMYCRVSSNSYTLQVLAECEHNERKEHYIFVVDPEKVEQFLQHNLAENQDVLADLGYLLALTLHDWQRWDENRDITQNTLLCIELESDPT